MDSERRCLGFKSRRVSPFGNLRVNGYLRLTEAYRSLSRPSSPADAKASSVCPCSLPTSPSRLYRKGFLVPCAQPQGSKNARPCSVFDSKSCIDACISQGIYGSPEKQLPRRKGQGVLFQKRQVGRRTKKVYSQIALAFCVNIRLR